jgi:GxxExxY protein
VERQKHLPLVYDGLKLDCAYRADIVVDGLVLVEVKAIETVLPAHRRQINTYIRLGDYRVGLLLNFGAAMMKQGIERIVNRFPDAGRLGS